MRCATLLALLTGVILYLVMGALVFSTLEEPNESEAYKDLLATKRTFLENKTCITEVDFHKLVKVSDILPLNSQCIYLLFHYFLHSHFF